MLAAALLLLMAPEGTALSGAAEPPVSVMVVETTRQYEYLGDYVPEDAGPDFIPFHSWLDMQVKVRRHLAGPLYPRRTHMLYVTHATHVPGVRLLVIAAPRSTEEGFFARWYGHVGKDGVVCVPMSVIEETGIESVLAKLPSVEQEDTGVHCLHIR